MVKDTTTGIESRPGSPSRSFKLLRLGP